MSKLLTFILKHRAIVLILAFFVAGLGTWAWKSIDVEAYPDISDTEVGIIAQLSGLPAEEMEQQVTVPIERALNTVPGVISKRSKTIFGLSKVTLTFNDKTDIYLARQLVLEKLRDAEIPEGVQPELTPMTMAMGEIFRYVIKAPDSCSITYLRELQDYVIIPKILQAEGVVDVSNFGGLVKQFQVIINPLMLEKYNLKVQDIADAIVMNNRSTGGNYIRLGSSQMNIRGIGRIKTVRDMEDIVVDHRNGVPILVRDVASIEIGNLPPTGILGYVNKEKGTARNMGIEGLVLLKKFENPSRTMVNVYEKVNELNNEILPPGIQVETFYDRTELVTLTIHTVGKTLLEGMIVVLIVLTLLLGNWRAAVISALAIPFSLLFAFICMYFNGIPANLLSLGAIDFGIIVDAAVVMVEAIFRNIALTKGKGLDQSVETIVIKSAREVQKQILYTVLIIIVALLPMFTLQRVEGRLFSPMAWTLTFAIMGSLVYALTLVPVISSYLFKPDSAEGKNLVWDWIEKSYRSTLRQALKKPALILTSSLVLVIIGFGVGSRLGTEFLPELDEGCVWVRVFLPSGISLEAASQYPEVIRKELAKYDEVKGVMTQLGRTDDGTDPFGPNRIEAMIQLKQPYSTWTSKRTKKELVKEIKHNLENILPGASFTITQPIIDMVTENATGSSSDLAIFVTGKNLDTLRTYAEKILKLTRQVQGASETAIEQENKQTQLDVAVDRNRAARYGVNVADVNAILEMAVGGLPVSTLWEDEKRFDIILRFSKESRKTPEQIGKIIIQTKSGMRIPLSQVADIRLSEGQSIIARDEDQRQITVKTNIRERDQGSFARELSQSISSSIHLPPNYHYSMGGQFENMNRAENRLFFIVPITLLLIFSILLILFKYQFKSVVIVMANIPFAAIGGIAALLIRNINISISAGVGFVSLAGVCVMSGVLWVSYLNRMVDKKNVPLEEIVFKGSLVQFRPIFLVMLIAIIGLLPAALNTGIGSDVQRPLATVIVGGLSSSLILTAYVTPVLYLLLFRKSAKS
ncbi:MAG: CusA/CzcA family heavy metal efflux RND transporter [Marinilabiliales bacterium]|nr:CusA/CzcA family heavy metal efflux RND transporter [Marinilabiliales bacterium]